MNAIETFALQYLSSGSWAVLKALFLLVVALIAATVVKKMVVALISKTGLNKLFEKFGEEERGPVIEFIGKLVFLIVFLLFVPGVFSSLGMSGISSPILAFLEIVWCYLPNLLAAGIVLWAGFFIARLVRELLVPLFKKININKLQEKAGIEVSDAGKLSNTLAYIVYVLILIPVIVAALAILQIPAVSDPAIEMLSTIFLYIPYILGALLIVVIGGLIARFAGNIVENLIAASGLDEKLAKLLDGKAGSFVLSKVTGLIVRIVLVIFFLVEGLHVLGLDVITAIGDTVIGYMPSALAAVLILLLCYLGSSVTDKALKKNGHDFGALAAKIAIYVLGGFMILSELGVASTIVNTAFIIVIAACGIAFALSFGLGGKDFAARTLARIEQKFDKKDE